ncbi:MAG: hypothetical protein CL741_06920 [Chloroflexi bacterium]|nr:hypothetical protein [Chloroflexota bacterium]
MSEKDTILIIDDNILNTQLGKKFKNFVSRIAYSPRVFHMAVTSLFLISTKSITNHFPRLECSDQ